MALLALSTFLYLYLYSNFKIPRLSLFIPLFVLIALVGTLIYTKHYRGWLSLVLLCMSFYIFFYSFKIIRRKEIVINITVISFFLFSIYYICVYRDYFLHPKTLFSSSTRLGSYFDNPNGVSAYSVIGFSFSIYGLLFFKSKWRAFFLIPAISMFLVGLSTGSRTFLIAIVIIFIFDLYFLFQKRKLLYLISILLFIGLFIGLINLPVLSGLKLRLINSIETILGKSDKPDTSTLSRVIWIDYGFWLGGKSLFFGYGAGGFSEVSLLGTYAHSNFAEVICDFGIFGFIVFYFPLLYILIYSFVHRKEDIKLIIPIALYYFLVGFTNVIYYKKIYYFILALLLYIQYSNRPASSIKKICFVCDSMGSGGAERVISILANTLASMNYKVDILGVSDFTNNGSFYKLENCKYHTILASGKRIKPLKRIRILVKKIKEISPDVVISFLPHVCVYSFIVCKILGIPYFVSERNDPKNDPKNKIIRILRSVSFCFSEGCVFQTQQAMEYYPFVVQKKSIIIFNPVSTSFACSKKIKINKEIINVGRMVPQKNQTLLLDAFSLFLKKCNDDYKLIIYGDGPLKNELIQHAIKIGIYDKVTFAGNSIKWLESSTDSYAFILTSIYEGFPNVLAEALCAGLPCVSTDCRVGGPRELIIDGVNGFLCKSFDAESLCDALVNIGTLSRENISTFSTKMQDMLSPKCISMQWIDYIYESLNTQ